MYVTASTPTPHNRRYFLRHRNPDPSSNTEPNPNFNRNPKFLTLNSPTKDILEMPECLWSEISWVQSVYMSLRLFAPKISFRRMKGPQREQEANVQKFHDLSFRGTVAPKFYNKVTVKRWNSRVAMFNAGNSTCMSWHCCCNMRLWVFNILKLSCTLEEEEGWVCDPRFLASENHVQRYQRKAHWRDMPVVSWRHQSYFSNVPTSGLGSRLGIHYYTRSKRKDTVTHDLHCCVNREWKFLCSSGANVPGNVNERSLERLLLRPFVSHVDFSLRERKTVIQYVLRTCIPA